MDDVRVIRRRTHVWPVVIALIVLALVIAWALFGMNGGPRDELGSGALPVPASDTADGRRSG
jgi:hypothetical protein